MTEVTTAAIKSNMPKPAARAFGPPNYEIPKSELPSMGIPEALRETAEKGVAQAKDTYENRVELLARMCGPQQNEIRRRFHRHQFLAVFEGRVGIGMGDLNDLEVVVCGALGGGRISVLEEACCLLCCHLRFDRAEQNTHRTRPEGDNRDRRAAQGQRNQGVQQQGCLTSG